MKAGDRPLTGKILKKVLALRDRYDDDHQHSDQVARLSLILFKELEDYAGYRELDPIYLEAGALLHDIGQWIGLRSHHKHSRDLILRDGIEGFRKKELMAIACIARYHRKNPPLPDHKIYRNLPEKWQHQVRLLSGILRVADGMDRTHRSLVKGVNLKKRNTGFYFYLTADREISSEIWGALRKKDLLEEILGSICTFEKEKLEKEIY